MTAIAGWYFIIYLVSGIAGVDTTKVHGPFLSKESCEATRIGLSHARTTYCYYAEQPQR